MKIMIREGMVPGGLLQAQLAWMESMGIDAVELHGSSRNLPYNELRRIVSDSTIAVSAAIEGISKILDIDYRCVSRRSGKSNVSSSWQQMWMRLACFWSRSSDARPRCQASRPTRQAPNSSTSCS